ncbi:hypothetical protein KEM54_004170 [Ascosphaera aggregata]|nr:hypothetical protein KEM54_004170 [Ascosphaera aggregata]
MPGSNALSPLLRPNDLEKLHMHAPSGIKVALASTPADEFLNFHCHHRWLTYRQLVPVKEVAESMALIVQVQRGDAVRVK